ncbi:SapC family protein [Paenalcaligenes niemegkensis]|uniref:SapC family protein n=1 Tax=Paenalcaligenes niemegkensis TaxID=2895469 RepID=UPI001EE857ED|nr:SapC family protein [Paenalcaligenes niemegkensis]MCQ9617584.1 SapC family protein [Paenalcaligenes niemegkensis]
MSGPMLYERTVALNKTEHHDLKINIRDNHYEFARTTNAMPLSISEFADASRNYPVVFIQSEENQFHVVALMGLENASNLFVSPEGSWDKDAYIPGFARRYPFILGTTEDKSSLAVYVDESYSGLGKDDGLAFFENGEESAYLKQLMEFLRAYQNEISVSQKFASRLYKMGLLEARSITVTQDGEDKVLSGFWVVNDEKFDKLDDKMVVELFHNGALALIELHRASLGNIQNLARRAERLTTK